MEKNKKGNIGCSLCVNCRLPFLATKSHSPSAKENIADVHDKTVVFQDVVTISEYKSQRGVKIEKCERLRFNTTSTKAAQMQSVRWGVPDSVKRQTYLLSWHTEDLLKISTSFYSQTMKLTFGTELPIAFGVDIPTFSSGILGYEEDLQGSPVSVDLLEADLSVANMLSDGIASKVSWQKLQWTHFEPHSPQVIQNPSIASKPSNFSLHSVRTSSFVLATQFTRKVNNRKERGTGVSMSSSTYKPHAPLSVSSSDFLFNDTPACDESFDSDGTGARIARHGAANTLKATVPFFDMLTEHGQFVATKILWCVSTNFLGVEFCPILPSLVCMLLLYLEEYEAYSLVHQLLTAAVKSYKADEERRVLILTRVDAIRVTKSTILILEKFSPRVCQHLRSLSVDVGAWVARYLLSGFAAYLPFNYILRIYGALIFEGVKILQRYVYAFIKHEEASLLKTSTKAEAEKVLSGSGFENDNPFALDELTRNAFAHGFSSETFGVKQFSTRDLPTAYLTTVKAMHFCRPPLMHRSKIVTDSNWERIWSSIPAESRQLLPTLVYRSTTDGMSIAAVFKSLWTCVDSQMVVFIKTTFNEVLGAYTPFAFRTDGRALQGSKDLSGSYVCRLQPDTVFYWWTGANKHLMDCSFTHLSIGHEDAALLIDDSVKRGESNYCASFGSPPLSSNPAGNNAFDIEAMEIWILQNEPCTNSTYV